MKKQMTKTQEKIEEMVDGYNVDKTIFRLDLKILVALAKQEQMIEDHEKVMNQLKGNHNE